MRKFLIPLVTLALTLVVAAGTTAGSSEVSVSNSVHIAGTVFAQPAQLSGSDGEGGDGMTDFGRVSPDGNLSVSVPAGTVVRNASGNIIPAYYVQVSPMASPPSPPENSSVIGLAYDLRPSGATFNPPISVTFSYDPSQLPEGVSESDLVIAFWDGSQWVELECVVDTVKNVITAKVYHFTTFAVIGKAEIVEPSPVPTPAPVPPVTPPPPSTISPPQVTPAPPEQPPTKPPAVIPAPATPSIPEAPIVPSVSHTGSIVAGIIGGVALILLAYMVWRMRRKRITE